MPSALSDDAPPAIADPSLAAFVEFARLARAEIDAALDRLTRFEAGCPDRLREAIRYSLLAPGKRLRPLLVLMAAEACGCPRGEAMPVACGVEMVHTYSLVHDDLPAMDNDLLRRGRPTCHVKYGEGLAILVGDALLAYAFEVVSTGVTSLQRAAWCCQELARAAGPYALVGGQVDDLQGLPEQAGWAELEDIHRRKTGAMFRASLRLGAIVADATVAQQQALEQYGEKLGLAFQIVDDLLDIRGRADLLGKSVGKDLAQGKSTYPALLGETASRARAETLIAEARGGLTIFGEQALQLDALARYVLQRDR